MSYITVDELRIASPCTSAEWADAKGGDDRARLCKTCVKNVYNLLLMTLDEANDLIREKEGKLCISLYHGFNGKVLTADAPKALRAVRRKYLKTRAKAIGLAFAIWGFITGTTSCYSTCNGPCGGGNINGFDFQADINGKHRDTYAHAINDTSLNEIMIKTYDSTMWIFIDSTERVPGTYENHHGVLPAGGYINPASPGSYIWYNGELKITSINSSHATGTFWFNANRTSPIDTVKITNGSFDVPVDYGKIPH